MNVTVTIDWKFAAALGATLVGIVFASKMDANAVEKVSIHVIDACQQKAIAGNDNR